MVQMDALRVARPDGKWSELRIQRIKASLAVAGGQPARISQVAVVSLWCWDHEVSILIAGGGGLGR